MSAPRVYYAMAKDGLFLQAVAHIHPTFETPAYAILIQGVVASALVVVTSFQQVLAYFIFVAVVFLALAGAGLLIARSRTGEAKPEFVTPAYPLPTLAVIAHRIKGLRIRNRASSASVDPKVPS